MKTNQMKAAYMHAYGGADLLTIRHLEKPAPAANEVLVKVIASTVTRADTMMLTGKPYIGRLFIGMTKPKYPVPGTGFAGIVEAVGADVTRFRIGDEVFGETTTSFSTNAEYVAVPETGVILPKPVTIPFSQAATYGDGHVTSYNFLHEIAGIKPGQKILVNGASGSLGSAAVQLARHFGAEVTAVCGTRNVNLIRSLGASKVIDYNKEDFTKNGERYDIIFDTIGKSSYHKCRDSLTENGQYLSPVLKFGLLLQSLRTSFFSRKSAKFAATGMRKDEELRSMLEELLKINASGGLKTIIDRTYELDDIALAHDYVSGGHKTGNVVINNAL